MPLFSRFFQPNTPRSETGSPLTVNHTKRFNNHKALYPMRLLCGPVNLARFATILRLQLWPEKDVEVRHILTLLPKYYQEEGPQLVARFLGAPTPVSWDKFRNGLARNICVLNLDLKNLPASRWFLATLLQSMTDPIDLPNLRRLEITANQDSVELSIAKKFFSNSVTHLAVTVYPSSASSSRRQYIRDDGLIPVFVDSSDSGTAACATLPPLCAFFKAIKCMENLESIKICVHDVDQMALALDPLLQTMFSLVKLRSAYFPPYLLSVAFVAALSTHPSLEEIGIAGRNSGERLTIVPAFILDPKMIKPASTISGLPIKLAKLCFASPIDAIIPFLTDYFNPGGLTSLHVIIILDVGRTYGLLDVCSAIANRCRNLEALE
ncbi:hypothetical protein PHLCEN_2v929, partial [Hermanssonia centrifuga]